MSISLDWRSWFARSRVANGAFDKVQLANGAFCCADGCALGHPRRRFPFFLPRLLLSHNDKCYFQEPGLRTERVQLSLKQSNTHLNALHFVSSLRLRTQLILRCTKPYRGRLRSGASLAAGQESFRDMM